MEYGSNYNLSIQDHRKTPKLLTNKNPSQSKLKIDKLSDIFLKQIDFANGTSYQDYKKGCFKIKANKKLYYVINTDENYDKSKINKDSKILYVSKKLFFKIFETCSLKTNIFLSSYTQIFHNPNSNANIFSSVLNRIIIFSLFVLFLYFSIFNELAPIYLNLIFLIQLLHKFIIFKYALFKSNIKTNNIADNDLPIYTILIPLYKEAARVPRLYDAIEKIDYPKNKLDIKFILEEDDYQTKKAVTIMDLPDRYHVIIVPNSLPKTKPKACNFAARYALGKYAVIYDSEDSPDRDQLKKAVQMFEQLPNEYACLQARLKITPSENSILGKLFMFEYDMWFKFMINSLVKLSNPVPLGGTSNHFKVEILEKIGLWDALNVTEDAEIGIRLASLGYKVGMIDSETKELEPISVKSWIKQRARWVKGFIITYFTYLLSESKTKKFNDFISTTLMLGTVAITFLSFPILIVLGINGKIQNLDIILFCMLNLSLFLIFFWYVAYLLFKENQLDTNFRGIIALVIFPAYFFLHTIATYLAIFELLFKPFRWNKTDHSF